MALSRPTKILLTRRSTTDLPSMRTTHRRQVLLITATTVAIAFASQVTYGHYYYYYYYYYYIRLAASFPGQHV